MASVVPIGTEASNSHVTVISVIDFIAKQAMITVTVSLAASLISPDLAVVWKKKLYLDKTLSIILIVFGVFRTCLETNKRDR